jgi:RNA polymerase sigma-70 factor (ECF subfamily)
MSDISPFHKSQEEIKSEAQIIELSKKDPKAFKGIYDKYFPQILNYVYNRMDDKDVAIDVTQQTFLKALKNIQKYENRGLPFSSWLYRIAHNELNDVFRKNAKLRTVNLTDHFSNLLQQEMEDEGLSDWLTKLKIVIRGLKEPDFRIVEMRFFEERPFAEIAEILEITENNARVKTYRILDKMKTMLLSANA